MAEDATMRICPFVVIVVSLLMVSKTIRGLDDFISKHHPEVPNKFRYATAETFTMPMPTIEQFLVNYEPRVEDVQEANSKYQINRRDLTRAQTVTDATTTTTSQYGVLDSEDRNLLDKFYSEIRNEDPFKGVDIQNLWNGKHDEELSKVLVDLSDQRQQSLEMKTLKKKLTKEQPRTNYHDWTIDPQLLMINNQIESQAGSSNLTNMMLNAHKIASYSPIHKLLTSYDPIAERARTAATNTHHDERSPRGNRVVGATLYGGGQLLKPVVSSKSSKLAIKLHDELLEEPPRDGIARVRMYFHRAIHDDVKLYGTGPWKYWGHGWGVEFGFDPRNVHNPNMYQKGYTIERAYGRDFCKDKKNCRPPDPEFFKSAIPKVGIK